MVHDDGDEVMESFTMYMGLVADWGVDDGRKGPRMHWENKFDLTTQFFSWLKTIRKDSGYHGYFHFGIGDCRVIG